MQLEHSACQKSLLSFHLLITSGHEVPKQSLSRSDYLASLAMTNNSLVFSKSRTFFQSFLDKPAMPFLIQGLLDHFLGGRDGKIHKFSAQVIDNPITFLFQFSPGSVNDNLRFFSCPILGLLFKPFP